MQHSRFQQTVSTGLMISCVLWAGLAASVAWMFAFPSLGKEIGVSLSIGMLTLFVGAIVSSFSSRYMRSDQRSTRFFLMLGLLVASVLITVFSANLLILALAWCTSSVLLAKLVGHCADWDEALAAKRRTQLAFAIGDVSLVAALSILGWQAGTLQLEVVLSTVSEIPAPLATAAALLLVIAAAARCALPPFSGWLLSSMSAPTPVSALMHAGLVNAGGFLLIRFAPLLEAAPSARIVTIAIGLFAAIYGLGIMMVRTDIKRTLAGSTVSQMGFMIMSCGLGAYAAALWHIVAHGLFKAWLFLGSGSAIGMKSESQRGSLSNAATAAIAIGTLCIAVSYLVVGNGSASLVPLLLGMATAMATMIACLGSVSSLRTKLSFLLLMAALAAFHTVGLSIAHSAVGADAQALVPNWALLALLATFLGCWVWQQHRLLSGAGLPARLFVHLINAGALKATRKGEAA